jgi:hypothetical protein
MIHYEELTCLHSRESHGFFSLSQCTQPLVGMGVGLTIIVTEIA